MKIPRKLKKAIKNASRTKYVLEMITGQLSYKSRLCGLTTTQQAVFNQAQADLLHPYPRTKHINRIYLNSIDDLISLDNRMFQVLMVCLREAKFCNDKNQDGNTLYNFKDFKDKCRKLIDNELSDKAINMYVSRLASMNILVRKSRGEFVLNPRYFVKGQMTPKTRLQLIVEYEGK